MVRFFESLIARRQALDDSGADSDYVAIPSSFSWPNLGAARDNSEYADAVAAFMVLMQRYSRFVHYLAPIFWHMATLDETTLAALDELLHQDEESGPALVNDLLREGPKGIAFSQSMFAMHVLSICAERSQELERDARNTLFSNALNESGTRVHVSWAQAPPGDGHVSLADALSALWPPGSLPHKFYAELANAQPISFPGSQQLEFEDEEDDDEPSPLLDM
jgi:hypothetical protein